MILTARITDALQDEKLLTEIRSHLERNGYVLFKSQFDSALCTEIKTYLNSILQNSLPNYAPIEEGTPNFYRLNFGDERAYVKGHFRQVSFFPWNQDIFSFFELYRAVFQLKNVIGGLAKDKFMGRKPEEDCTARISFQFYDSGRGYLNRHSDPVGPHQLALPSLILSKRGQDFQVGGLMIQQEGRWEDLEAIVDIGDVLYFNGEVPHGISPIDPGRTFRPTHLSGRWVGVMAINKLASTTHIGNSKDLGTIG